MACPDEGVTVLAGHRLRAWLEALPVDPAFDRTTVDRVWSGIAAHVGKRDQHNESKTPRVRTPQQWAERAAFAVVAFGVAVWLVALVVTIVF